MAHGDAAVGGNMLTPKYINEEELYDCDCGVLTACDKGDDDAQVDWE